jgi:hypothetical protein
LTESDGHREDGEPRKTQNTRKREEGGILGRALGIEKVMRYKPVGKFWRIGGMLGGWVLFVVWLVYFVVGRGKGNHERHEIREKGIVGGGRRVETGGMV